MPSRMMGVSFVCALLIGLLSGCGGGGGGQPTTGKATFHVNWPSRAPLIPAATNSIRVEIKQQETVLANRVLARPNAGGSASLIFENLPLGDLLATASAYPTPEGTGVSQATASTPIQIAPGSNTDFTISMVTTINRLDLSPSNFTVEADQNRPLTVTARDAHDAIVLLTAKKLAWTSQNTDIATVDADGIVHGVAPGSAQIRVEDSESGKVGTITVQVPIIVRIVPPTVTVAVGQEQTFTAQVIGNANTTVSWSVQGGASHGTITTAGLYTAPSKAGVYTIEATSQADPQRKATATITVQSGSASGTVQ